MLILEAEHGTLPGTSPALTDVLSYLEKVLSLLTRICFYQAILSRLRNLRLLPEMMRLGKEYTHCLLMKDRASLRW